MLQDHWGRQIKYLRISITDHCNLRCVYCMPEDNIHWYPHESIMRYEEIEKFARVAAKFGVRSVRLTGGEPLVRPDVVNLIRLLADIPEIEDISLTTNGMLLEKMAQDLKAAGLNRVNVSMDTLNPELFKKITRHGSLEQVWSGILEAEKVGLNPIKINVVAMRGVNDQEFRNLALLTLEHQWHVRFIELMPIKNQVPWGNGFPLPDEAYISTGEIQELLHDLDLKPVTNSIGVGPAKIYAIEGGKGAIGFISPLGEEHFCARCNRMRLTADGHIRPCLMSDVEIDALSAMRQGLPIEPLLQEAVKIKPEHHELALNLSPIDRNMMQIGG
ncbi:MAG: GTP 3',8-cyclase MoaA [Anaerolineaceae bacterium]